LSLRVEPIADLVVTSCRFTARKRAGHTLKTRVTACKSLYLLGFYPTPSLTAKAGIRYAGPVRINLNSRGTTASQPPCRLARVVGLTVVAAALAAPLGAAVAAPQSVRQPALRPVDDQGLLDSMASSVANKSSQLITQVRDGASGLVDSAMNFLGVRYKLGGNSAETGFDCSGFTRYVFENSLGRVLPHRADEQANAPELAKVDKKDLKPGDLVFFDTMRRTFSHVGIYLGDGKFIHSPRTGETIRIEDINISYWARHFTGGRRVPELADAGGTPTAAGNSMLASLGARLGVGGGGNTASVVVPVASPAALQAASLNPSGLRAGSTLPSLPAAAPTSLGPSHEPFVRQMTER
jgi:cell wall-associated NlpC family hydrolase